MSSLTTAITDKGNPAIAVQYFKRMANDYALGKNDLKTMTDVVKSLLPKNDDGTPKFDMASREAAAKTLIKSLNGAEVSGGEGQGRPISLDAQNEIMAVFTNPAVTSVEALGLSLDNEANKKDLWALFIESKSEFDAPLTKHELEGLQLWLDSMGMGALGGMFKGLLGVNDDTRPSTPENIVRAELAEGFNVIAGGQWSLGKFHYGPKDVNGESIDYNHWNGPSAHEYDDFFSEEGMPGRLPYQLKENDASLYGGHVFEPMKHSFEAMIFSKWEEDGLIRFEKDTNGDLTPDGLLARNKILADAEEIYRGKPLDTDFTQTLKDSFRFIEFTGGSAAEDKFNAFVETLEPIRMTEIEIADAVIGYVARAADVKFGDNISHDDQVNVIASAAQEYVPATGKEAANRLMQEIDRTPSVSYGAEREQGARSPTAVAGAPSSTTATATAAARPEAIQAARLDEHETGRLDYSKEISGKLDPNSMAVTAADGTALFTFADDGFVVSAARIVNQGGPDEEIVLDPFDTEMTPDELHARLGSGELTIQLVAHTDAGTSVEDSQFFGYHIKGDDGKTSFYVGTSAIPEDEVTDAFRAERKEELENNTPQNQQASLAQNAGITVDGEQQDPNMFSP